MKYDLAIIGGGPAGLIAALRAGELGQKIVLLEKNERLGLKLLITGGGRCNLTNNISDYRLLAASFGLAGRFLLSVFSRFDASETIDFFENHGLKIKTDKDNKVFPVSDRAMDVLNLLIQGIKKTGGLVMTGSPVKKIIQINKKIAKIILADGREISAANYLIATGGLSYPTTGSSGDGYKWLKDLGHTIKPLRPALVPLMLQEKFIKNLEGLSLDDIILRLYFKDKKLAQEKGAIIFTAQGLSGPVALNISRHINPLNILDYSLELDLQPQQTEDSLAKYLEKILVGNNKLLKNSLEVIIPERLAEIIVDLSGLSDARVANSLNRLERANLARLIKNLKLKLKSLEGYERAMVTAGGVDLKEIDPKTMRSKIITNLFLAGEVLDLAGPTGGYNLQLAWSTGQAVAEAVAEEK